MPSLPVDGASAWGDTLNSYLTALDTEANSTQTGLANHAANSPADPHQDRAYALSLVSPIISGVNSANGYVKLNSSGFIPAALVNGSSATGGAYSGVYDAVTMFGATPGTGSDQSPAIQAALTAAGNAGGGLVYIGPGVFSLANYLIIPSNVHLVMSNSTTLSRIVGTATPSYLITNVLVGSGNTPGSNVHITGGAVNTYGSQSLTSSCSGIYMVQPSTYLGVPNCYIDGVRFYTYYNHSPIYLNGSIGATVKDCAFTGVQAPSSTILSNGAITLNGTLNVSISGCYTEKLVNNSLNGTFGYLVLAGSIGPDETAVTGCTTAYPSSNGYPIYGTAGNNNVWISLAEIGNAWYEFPVNSSNWNDLRPLQNGFNGSISGSYPPQVRLTLDGTVQLFGSVEIPSGSYNGVTFATLPSGLIPSKALIVPVAGTGTVGADMTNPAGITINTSGNLSFHNLPGSLSSGTQIWFSASWPSDYSGVIKS